MAATGVVYVLQLWPPPLAQRRQTYVGESRRPAHARLREHNSQRGGAHTTRCMRRAGTRFVVVGTVSGFAPATGSAIPTRRQFERYAQRVAYRPEPGELRGEARFRAIAALAQRLGLSAQRNPLPQRGEA